MPVKQIYKSGSGLAAGVAVTSTNTYYSDPVTIDGETASVHLVWTQTVATLTGTFTLWYSNKPNADLANDTDWVQDTTFPAPSVSGTGKAFINISAVGASKVRLKYVNATGSGTLQCWAYTSNGRS